MRTAGRTRDGFSTAYHRERQQGGRRAGQVPYLAHGSCPLCDSSDTEIGL